MEPNQKTRLEARGWHVGDVDEFLDAALHSQDYVNHPAHYTSGNVECVDAMESMGTPEEFRYHCRMDAIKYLWRCTLKGNERQDYEKCVWYLKRAIESYDKQHITK
jgi:hypothetical protein